MLKKVMRLSGLVLTCIKKWGVVLLNYLHATGFKLGLLLNFGHYPKLEHERFVL
jgi:hypothetical protein